MAIRENKMFLHYTYCTILGKIQKRQSPTIHIEMDAPHNDENFSGTNSQNLPFPFENHWIPPYNS